MPQGNRVDILNSRPRAEQPPAVRAPPDEGTCHPVALADAHIAVDGSPIIWLYARTYPSERRSRRSAGGYDAREAAMLDHRAVRECAEGTMAQARSLASFPNESLGEEWQAYKGRPAPPKPPAPPPKQAPVPSPGAPKPEEPKPSVPPKEGCYGRD